MASRERCNRVNALLAAAVVGLVPLMPLSAEAQAVAKQSYQRGPERLGSISRGTFQQIYQLGGGLTDQGYFIWPVRVRDVFPNFTRGDGLYLMAMQWDPTSSVLYEVRNGHIVRLDYWLNE